MLAIGDKAPDFSLLSDDNQAVTLKSLRGKNVILYFYPKDDTPGCTQEACDFRDNLPAFIKKNTVIIGISKDTVAKHQKFKGKYELPFTLLADVGTEVCQAYGALGEKSLYGKKYIGILRTTFWIDEKGIVRGVWQNVKVKGHVSDVLEAL